MAFLATCDRPHSDFVFAERFGTQPREAIVKLDALSSGAILSLTPLVGLSEIFGRLAGGWLLDRFRTPAVGFVISGLSSIACRIPTNGELDYTEALTAILLIGFCTQRRL